MKRSALRAFLRERKSFWRISRVLGFEGAILRSWRGNSCCAGALVGAPLACGVYIDIWCVAYQVAHEVGELLRNFGYLLRNFGYFRAISLDFASWHGIL